MFNWSALVTLITGAANMMLQPSPVVKTANGLVRGRISENGGFYQYFGIPYATVNDKNRFQAPLPAPKWKGILEAVDEARCPQKFLESIIIGDSDCLKLNIYTPAGAKANDHFPVMVYIHGGCFYEGSGSSYLFGGDFLVEHSVVFVSINYRLSVEGFLCLGIKEAPGNAGLKDQIAALKWIRDNIKTFNGNPNDVTLFGESAGAVSTSFLILSPSAQGLFHKAILQSGSSLAPWGLQHDPIETASSLVKEFGFNTKDPYEIYSIISNKTANELIIAMKFLKKSNSITSKTLFVPCVENDLPGVNPFITEHPREIMKSGNYTKVPMIIGINDNEGIYFVAAKYGTDLKEFNIMDILQPDLVFSNESERKATIDRITRYYFSTEKDDQIMDMVNLFSDVHFKFPSADEAELYTKTNDKPIFFYQFKYGGFMNMAKVVSMFGDRQGATHGDDLFYIFKSHVIPLPFRYLENKMIKRMVTMWTNFAKYSDPTPNTSQLLPVRWRPSRDLPPRALIIDRQFSISTMWDPGSVAFWHDIYKEHRRKTYGFKHLNSVISNYTYL